MKPEKRRYSEVIMTVPFHDLDPMRVVWHGNYMKYFDKARFKLFHDAGIDLFVTDQRPDYLLPVIRTSTKYINPLRHRDEFVCRATLVEVHVKIVIDFEIRLTKDGTRCTRARSEQVAVKVPEMETMLELPEEVVLAFRDWK